MVAPAVNRQHLSTVLDELRERVVVLKATFTDGTMQRQCVVARLGISHAAEVVAQARSFGAIRAIAGLVDVEATRVEWLESILRTSGPEATLIG
jgi:hypothetical protein